MDINFHISGIDVQEYFTGLYVSVDFIKTQKNVTTLFNF